MVYMKDHLIYLEVIMTEESKQTKRPQQKAKRFDLTDEEIKKFYVDLICKGGKSPEDAAKYLKTLPQRLRGEFGEQRL